LPDLRQSISISRAGFKNNPCRERFFILHEWLVKERFRLYWETSFVY
jgi:hypothetical protein